MTEETLSGDAPGEATPRGALERTLSEVPFHALLLSAYPVLLLYGDNVVDVAPSEVALPLLAVMGVAMLLLAVLARLLRSWPRAGLIVTATVLPFLLAGLFVDMFKSTWPDDSLFRLHAIAVTGWLAMAMIGIYLALRAGSRLRAATQLLNIGSLVLIVLAVLPTAGDFRTSGAEPDRDETSLSVSAPVATEDQRDIYHLVFDRYGSERSLELGRDIDNSEFMEWLRGNGFTVVDDARANFERTALSLSSIHDMSLHQELIGSGTAGYDDLVSRIRSSRAATVLQELGYEYVVAGSWWAPSAYSDIADLVVEPRYVMSFGSALVDRSLLPSLEALAAIVTKRSIDGSDRQIAQTTVNQFRALETLAGKPGPQLVFAHFLVPHDPFVLLADGSIDGREATFETQLHYTNEQLRRLIEPLLKLPAEDQPIIILQADEGPYPERYDEGLNRDTFDWATATDEELLIKFGVLNAIYLPGAEGEPTPPDGLSLVNTYPEILRAYHGLEIDDLPDRTYGMVNGDYFDLIDITDRVDEAFEELVPS